MAPQRKKRRFVLQGTEKAPEAIAPGRRVKVEKENSEEEVSLEVDREWLDVEAQIQSQNEKLFEKESQSLQAEEDLSEEERFNKLLDLLGKSKFYSEHLQSKLKDDNSKKLKEEMLKKRKKPVLKTLNNSSSSSYKKRRRFSIDDDDCRARLFQGKEIPEDQPLLVKGGIMRDYQIKGYQWMCSLWENGINGILADEMGLGKTLQTISLFAHLVEMGVEGPFLVVAPLSTLLNWVSEIKRFTPDIPVVLFHGNKKKRAELFRRVKEVVHIPEIAQNARTVFVTSYEIILNSRKSFKNAGWKYIVVDEGHRLKNTKCQLVRELRLYETANKLLLTGTPLQNNLAELWSLLNFLMPEIFNDLTMFQSWFSLEELQDSKEKTKMGEREARILTTLHQILSPFLLRRIKSDIDLKIPPKKEIIVYCPMTEHQTIMYKATINRTLMELFEKDESRIKEDSLILNCPRRSLKEINYCELRETCNIKPDSGNGISFEPKVNVKADLNYSHKNRSMDLRKITNHPYLLEYPLTEDGMFYRSDQEMIDNCGKLKVLDQLLNELIVKRQHKCLIFSQMTRMLDILGDYLNFKGFKFARLDGTMAFDERQENIDMFSTSSDVNLFLLSTRAGGLGINLTAADTVIIYDSDWNPQQDLQAQDRCHRIGQSNPVIVYRLVTANTIDEKIVHRASSKRLLEKMIIHEKKFKSESQEMNFVNLTPKDLKDLLKSCDHAKVVDRKSGPIFTPKEIAALMDRRVDTKPDSVSFRFEMVQDSSGDSKLSSIVSKENSILN